MTKATITTTMKAGIIMKRSNTVPVFAPQAASDNREYEIGVFTNWRSGRCKSSVTGQDSSHPHESSCNGVVSPSFSSVSTTNTASSLAGSVLLAFSLTLCQVTGHFGETLSSLWGSK